MSYSGERWWWNNILRCNLILKSSPFPSLFLRWNITFMIRVSLLIESSALEKRPSSHIHLNWCGLITLLYSKMI